MGRGEAVPAWETGRWAGEPASSRGENREVGGGNGRGGEERRKGWEEEGRGKSWKWEEEEEEEEEGRKEKIQTEGKTLQREDLALTCSQPQETTNIPKRDPMAAVSPFPNIDITFQM